MNAINFSTTILKYGKQGEKTGWTFIEIPAKLAQILQSESKQSFRVKGTLDDHQINGVALIPVGGGDYIMALNADLRRAIKKPVGAILKVQIALDEKPYQVNSTFLQCLADEPAALVYFKLLPLAHQNYFSKWIEAAKTEPTKIKRIGQSVAALALKMGFPEMLKQKKNEQDLYK